MQKEQKDHLIQKIKETLSEGGNITVYGWRDSNHSPQTREYGKTGRIIFVERRDKIVGVNGDLVIFTRFIKHADQEKMQGKMNLYPHTVEIGITKAVLAECEDLIVRRPQHTTVEAFNFNGINPGPVTQDLNELEYFLRQTEVQVDQFDKLAERFKEAAQDHPGKLVSTNVLAKILKELEPPPLTIKELVSQGWLIAVRAEGKTKVGWYQAGEKLQYKINGGKTEEPTDPIEKAYFLINREPAIDTKIAEIEKELDFWNTQKKRVIKAKDLVHQLGEV